ncbi:MAG: glycoside hydrolase [Candidatus Muproteobacteria bacterium RIFCSPHIGHO2_01_FULL_65_16]|uniref:Glycoside hydrolase n=1 Tax=Candidatus Muproteobacteria bacterium RIFCSPHIGHO2_01_FULL_65_16 TaxID=1817764 RepID=A0A1F6TPL5_9PROT|nr:MAG: glycoside hydrolase [Candidatus Muproteobacteria bacterium RIFCSPHIGHO2_01_FULL_65_16]
MSADARLKVVLCWHMHQPQYRDLISGAYHLPWTYLHAIKDYVDMAAHLEAHPSARAVINLAPLLLEQIEDYAGQVDGFLSNSRAIRDPLLASLAAPLPADAESRLGLIKACLRANETRMIQRFAPYRRLAEMAKWLCAHTDGLSYLSDQFLADLLAWHHLAWLGETVRRTDARVKRLLEKGAQYTLHDRRELLAVIGELLTNILPRYARLAGSGRVELSVTPYAHPIIPLLLDFHSAREAAPHASLPLLERYPGGEERARWHIQRGIETFRKHFGHTPAGCWPAEGAISARTLRLLREAGFTWAASGEGVLRHSLARSGHAPHAMKEAWLYRPYAPEDGGIACFFRDDGLSDLIGFTYAGWHGDDAVNNFTHHLEQIAVCCRGHSDRVVSVILDGENAWEHYPENAYYFLDALYARLAQHPAIELTTFSDCLKTSAAGHLPQVVAGSWVYGTFSTWVGDPDKNRAWDMLGDAKRAFDAAAPRLGTDQLARAERQLAVCEGSDWFWWFGADNPAATVSDFEHLYRRHLTNLYQLLGVEPPEYLAHVFAHGRGAPLHGGVMRPGQPAA